MPYKSRRTDNSNAPRYEKDYVADTSFASQKEKDNAAKQKSSTKAAKTAAKAAGAYFGGPLGAKAVDAASKTKAGQNLLNKGGQVLNGIPGMGRASKKLDDSGVLDAADRVLDVKGLKDGGVNTLPSSASNSNANTNNKEKNDATDAKDKNTNNIAGVSSTLNNEFSKENLAKKKEEEQQEEKKTKARMSFFVTFAIQAALFLLFPILMIAVLVVAVIGNVSGTIDEFGDALGALSASGGETGEVVYEASEEASNFYQKINTVKLSYQSSGKTVDVLKVAAVYHILAANGADMTYDNMTEDKIRQIVDIMYSGNTYNEDTFKQNLITYLIPMYLPNTSDVEREQIADDVFDYIDRYNSFIGNDAAGNGSYCASVGSCMYDIKGFYISSSGNITKNMQVSNLQVRLMECGSPYGNGSYSKAIDQPLVPFEDYVMGVAYAEIGASYPEEALKAFMIAARSFALSRPTAMGNAAGKKLEQENGQWILQISSCVADQVFCNVDEGCSYMGGGDGQGGIVRSGHVDGAARYREALPADHRLRSIAASVQGEVLVNEQGYIINSGYLSTEQRMIKSLAEQGLNYKQILLQVYNQGSRNYGATDIQKMSCNSGTGCVGSASSGPYASWKQYQGSWTGVQLGSSGKTIKQVGCLVTSVAMLIAKSGVQTNIADFNPGTFVTYLNSHGGFSGANFVWASVSQAAPNFKYVSSVSVAGQSQAEKLNTLKGLLDKNYYVVAEVKGNTGEHWVAVDGISGDGKVLMMDPGSESTDMWGEYPWGNTSRFSYFQVS